MAAPISASVIPDSETSRRAVLMSMPNCDTQPNQRQYASVFAGIYTPTYRSPMDMRSLLKALMALRDENAYGLESRSGVPGAARRAPCRCAGRRDVGRRRSAIRHRGRNVEPAARCRRGGGPGCAVGSPAPGVLAGRRAAGGRSGRERRRRGRRVGRGGRGGGRAVSGAAVATDLPARRVVDSTLPG